MKTLVLIRHAKSDWGNEILQDFDRPLNTRGYDDAYRMSSLIAKENLHPTLLLSSPAIRAYSTAIIFARNLKISTKEIQLEQNIYEAEVGTLVSVIKSIDNKHNVVFMFGHNPGFTELFNRISMADIDNIPTCGVMKIQFKVNDWEKVDHVKGDYVSSHFPKEFK